MTPNEHPQPDLVSRFRFAVPALFFARARLRRDHLELSGWHLGGRYRRRVPLAEILQTDVPCGDDLVLWLASGQTLRLAVPQAARWKAAIEARQSIFLSSCPPSNMKRTLILVLLAASPTLVHAQTVRQDATADDVMTRFAEAWSRDDSIALLRLFADDIVLLGGSDTLVERAGVEAWRRQQMHGTDILAITPLQSSRSGSLAYQIGRWSLTHAGGTSTGSHTFILRREADGAWRIAAMEIEDDPKP